MTLLECGVVVVAVNGVDERRLELMLVLLRFRAALPPTKRRCRRRRRRPKALQHVSLLLQQLLQALVECCFQRHRNGNVAKTAAAVATPKTTNTVNISKSITPKTAFSIAVLIVPIALINKLSTTNHLVVCDAHCGARSPWFFSYDGAIVYFCRYSRCRCCDGGGGWSSASSGRPSQFATTTQARMTTAAYDVFWLFTSSRRRRHCAWIRTG